MAVRFDGRYWRPAGFYFTHFAGLGILVPYWPVYLQAQGFAPLQISTVMSALICSRLFAPFFWGALADRYARPTRIVRLTSAAAAVTFTGLLLTSSVAATVGLTFLFGLFWSAPLPQVEALTLASQVGAGRGYGLVRLWGSIGYILTAGLFGTYIELAGPHIVPGSFLLTLVLIWLVSLLLQADAGAKPLPETESFWAIVRRREVAALLLVCVLMQVGHGPYYTFFSIYIADYAYGAGAIGRLWALGVLAEVGMFLVMQTLIARFGLRCLLLSATLAAVARWSVIATLAANPAALVFAQLLHAGTFGVFHAVAVQMIFHYFHGPQQGRGQALYSSLAYGGGGAVGAMVSGYGWTTVGASVTFLGAALVSLLALGIGTLHVSDPTKARSGSA
jgi:MFS transporter, PPP family, 3-phenylpropionic acid transporter